MVHQPTDFPYTCGCKIKIQIQICTIPLMAPPPADFNLLPPSPHSTHVAPMDAGLQDFFPIRSEQGTPALVKVE